MNLLGGSPAPQPSRDVLAPFITKRVPLHFLSSLEDIPTCLEIQRSILSISSDRASGPDGYNAHFFKQSWHIVGPTIIKAVKKFFINGMLLKECNAAYICLVPKSPNPSSLDDCRPISCCNVIYKGIAKLLASKLQPTLPHVIEPTQTAFIQGRKITDTILLAQELMRGYHSSNLAPRCAWKVDLTKAFDSVNWSFIIDTPPQVNLMDSCLHHITYIHHSHKW
ncbi:uncharacterized protein LOC132314477 [Cornus florida]|uniref:uncharacterized protein LOC132314477 n=1 Tax=Cornus florida TaxID=4283 RepID=UPI00289F4A27|nr:uncharacterized protein LOC132314477 [Cornus florida]